jgi:hypothetical protein
MRRSGSPMRSPVIRKIIELRGRLVGEPDRQPQAPIEGNPKPELSTARAIP